MYLDAVRELLDRIDYRWKQIRNRNDKFATLFLTHVCFVQARVREDFIRFANAVIRVQDPSSGRWHQVLNDTQTYLETSATAMIVASLYCIVVDYMLGTTKCAYSGIS